MMTQPRHSPMRIQRRHQGKDFIEVRCGSMKFYLSDKVDDIDPFVWPFLRDNLDVCHCIFSRSSVSITPIFPLVDLLPAFDNCERRIYMSATIADDSEIVRTFGASREAVSKPVTSESLAGVGERMILVPGLMRLGRSPVLPMVKDIASKIAKAKLGVAILSPSPPLLALGPISQIARPIPTTSPSGWWLCRREKRTVR